MIKKETSGQKVIYFLAVPIGNVKDLSLRGQELLSRCDLILCEDTRKTKDFMGRLNIKSSAGFKVLNAYKEKETNWSLFFESVDEYSELVYVSDAGTPLLNDPGRRLLFEAEKRGLQCVAIPGPSAPVVAIQRSGAFGLPFSFNGFVPKKSKKKFFDHVDLVKSFIFFDTKHSVKTSLEFLIKEGFSERSIVICRELTKEHEEIFRGLVSDSLAWIQERLDSGRIGELTLILEGTLEQSRNVSLEELLSLLKAGSTKQKAEMLSKLSGVSKKHCYDRLLED